MQVDRTASRALRPHPHAVLLAQHHAMLDRDAAAVEAAMRNHMAEVLKIVSGLPARHPELF